ncbi:hypothetical protein RJZ56_006457 [Blastomyces dermatitidis]|uniref:Riboflavin aldehyde-forming enzyme n=1 Tax=Blastomyces gilchristii (strain SLH14081) TaxID=559298 RepID=A0A179UJD6_BLAGS|nr:riboflavin aldehyde-forming enzyme [Blastomyces gilchristii SLH14081]EQL31154.1 hypothetical protein BDFG_06465 [Blastomyces dermatitidis ATCC 26199]OAT07338.1 riboflavin aldehyde-forming enzyme [Blastomyces gilchristii SLH14081]
MPPSISTISSLTRTISSTSIHSLKDEEPARPHPLRSSPTGPQPEHTAIKHVKSGSAQISVSEIPKRKPVAFPATTTTTTVTAIPYQDSPSAENGAGAASTNPPWLSFIAKLKRPFPKLTPTAAWPTRQPASEPATAPAATKSAAKSAATSTSTSAAAASHLDNIKAKLPFQSNKKKQRIFLFAIGGIILLHLILVIGLAAGLSARKNKGQGYGDLPLPSAHGGPYTGDLTYYDPGLGACGIESAAGEPVCAVSQYLYDAVAVGTNPNANPLCGKRVRLRRAGRSVDVTVVDRCVGCQPNDIDVSLSVFTQLALEEQGRVDVQWAWLEETPLQHLRG